MENKILGKRLANLRKGKGLSQSELVRLLNVSNKLISKWENSGAVPALEYLRDYSRIFGVSLDEMLDDAAEFETEKETKATKHARLMTLLFLLAAFLPFSVAVIAYFYLPDMIPAHYDGLGQITRWGEKIEMVLYACSFTGLSVAFTALLTNIKALKPHKYMFYAIGGLISLGFLFLQIYLTVKAAANGYSITPPSETRVLGVACAATALLFLYSGLIMPFVKQNVFFGLRINSTMDDPENWEKTHRMAAICFVAGGVLCAFLCVVLSAIVSLIVCVSVFLAVITVPIIYSLKLQKKKRQTSGRK